MEQYLERKNFIENVVLHPKYLDKNLFKHLELILTKKYSTNYNNKGFIFNIKIESILDNQITMSNQILLKVQFSCDYYVPQVGHIFKGVVKKKMSKYQWINVNSLIIYLQDNSENTVENTLINVEITKVKNDNTLCFGKVVN